VWIECKPAHAASDWDIHIEPAIPLTGINGYSASIQKPERMSAYGDTFSNPTNTVFWTTKGVTRISLRDGRKQTMQKPT
jgi:hypothetical protein